MTARILHALRNLVSRSRLERDLDDELRASFELLADEKVRAGMDPKAARRAAAIELHIESVKEQVREVRAGSFVETLAQDVRYAARLLRRNPLFALTAALSLAIGIGATTAVFTVANGLLLSVPRGVAEPSGLVDIARVEPGEFGVNPIPYANYLAVRQSAKTLAGVYGYELNLQPVSLRAEASSERIFASFVTLSYFDVLGVRPAAGRLFGRGDVEAASGSPIVVLSDALWQRRFNRDPTVVGKTFAFNGYPLTVAGVADERFRGTSILAPDVWIPAVMMQSLQPDTPINFSAANGPVNWQLMMGARLAPGVSRGQAAAEIQTIGAELERNSPTKLAIDISAGSAVVGAARTMAWTVASSSPIPAGLRLAAAGFIGLLLALVSIVLVIACANLTGVLLARATVRQREIALRIAVGAARARLIRQLLTETMLLFLLGGVAGVILARVISTLVMGLLPAFPMPVNLSMPLDGRVLAFSLAVSLIAALASGFAPALRSSRADVVTALKDDAQAPVDTLRLRNAFVAGQVAFSILLVMTAAILTRGLGRVTSVDRGFDPQHVETASIDLTMAGYGVANGPGATRQLLESVRALSGVQHATLADRAPGPGAMSLGGLTVPGVTPPRGEYFFANTTIVDADYFATLGIPAIAGRDFTADDRSNSTPVAILGESAARRFFPGKDAVGQTIFTTSIGPFGSGQQSPLTIVGVVRDVRFGGPRNSAPMNMYVPLPQHYRSSVTILAKMTSGRTILGDIRTVVAAVSPNLPVFDVQPLERQLSGPVETQLRIASAVAGGVGIIGLLLAAVGIYGVTAYAVTRRTREIGIRLSLGATRAAVVGMVLRQGMRLVAIGSAIGLVLGFGAGQLLSGARFGVPPPDAMMFAGVAAIFALVGLTASYVPARHATRVSATDALRCE
jgi:predicted permease